MHPYSVGRRFILVAAGALISIAPAQAVQLPGAERPLTDAEIGYLLMFGIILVAYFVPTLFAFVRQHPNRWVILVINTVFGGTGLGWLGSLVWALSAVHRSPTGNHGGESGLNLFANDVQPVRLDPAPAAPTSLGIDELADQLARLKTLRDAGDISSDEHDALRRAALARAS